MKNLNDPVFGLLTLDTFWKKKYQVEFFKKNIEIDLVVQTFDDDPISDNQRETFIAFEKEKKSIISILEKSIENYVKNRHSEHENINDLIKLRKIKIIYTENGDPREVAFILDSSLEPELGIGAIIKNEKACYVDVQDIALG